MAVERMGLVLAGLCCIFLFLPATEIHDAAQQGNLDRVRELLGTNAGLVNQKDSGFGRTPLHWAARGIHFGVMRLLLEKGADPGAKDNSGITALHSVSARGHKEAAALLLAAGADINAEDGFGKTPLAYAVTGKHKELIDFLVSNEGIVPVLGEPGRKLLHDAAIQGDLALVEWMMAKGIEVSTQNGNGGTLLHSVSEGGLADVADRLIGIGLAVNTQDRYGFSALHHAARNGHWDVAEILLRNKADINTLSLAGESPLHIARRAEKMDLAERLIARGANQGSLRFPALKGEYLGQKKPGGKPELFARGIISSIDWEHSAPVFSPDGREVFWTSISDGMKILRMRSEGGAWQAPEAASFSGFEDCYPCFSSDGRRLYYVSYRPLKDGVKNAGIGINLWFVERAGDDWAEPRSVGSPFTTGNTFGFSLTEDGTVYFTDASKGFDIFRSRLVGGRYAEPEKLGPAINSDDMEDEPFIAPDESCLIFKSMRPGGFGGADLYISSQRADGSWTEASNLGPTINTAYGERFPAVSRDGKYFFFGSDRNGNRGDIYWVKTDFLFQLKSAVSARETGLSKRRSEVAFRLADKGLITEGIAYDPVEGVFFVSSVHKRKIIGVDRGGGAEDFSRPEDGLWAVLGLRVDPGRRLLWGTTAAIPQMEGFIEEDRNRTGVFKYDLEKKQVLKVYLLDDAATDHLIGDLTLGANGDVYATDSLDAAIYRISKETDALELIHRGRPLSNPQGLAVSTDGGRLFVADYPGGIFVFDLPAGGLAPLAPPEGESLAGIDGLYSHGNTLLAIQNGVTPNRILRIILDNGGPRAEKVEILDTDNPSFDEPTLGVVVGDKFYYIANSQWGRVDESGRLAPEEKLKEPLVLMIRLARPIPLRIERR